MAPVAEESVRQGWSNPKKAQVREPPCALAAAAVVLAASEALETVLR